ncbi:MAG: hypothetical protein ACYTFY_22140 [Planctomycetota bacterium]|jgi:hypothetical protein
MEYALKEDDFLFNKLGRLKPNAEEVVFRELSSDEQADTAELKKFVIENFKGILTEPEEKPFSFLRNFTTLKSDWKPLEKKSSFDLRLAYSYSAVYGDPLLNEELDPYPEGLLASLSENGINAVWLQGILYTLVPWLGDNKYSKGHETRIKNLKALIKKAEKYGIGVYLYLNEPRAMPHEFFENHKEWSRGSINPETKIASICTSDQNLKAKLKSAVKELFTRASGLAGAFTITRSENMTHCHSHSYRANVEMCKKCTEVKETDMIAEVNNIIEEGMHAANRNAKLIAWSWAWTPESIDPDMGIDGNKSIKLLNKDISLMNTQENYVSTKAESVSGVVSDYSMSKVGPAKEAVEYWDTAKESGLERIAKIQLNNTWECSAVPYLPVPTLVKETLTNIEKQGVTGLMVAWTLGGFPGGNLKLIDMEVDELANDLYGNELSTDITAAWEKFAEGFKEFPLNGAACLYNGPQNYGPMNLLYAEPSGYNSTMVGFPYDDLDSWSGRGFFPVDIFESQFKKLSNFWKEGLKILKSISNKVPAEFNANYIDLLNVAEAAYCHFRSTYLQIRFIRLRDSNNLNDINEVIDEEIELAKTLLNIVRKDSRIGFEASNHYYYSENSLREKVLNCEEVKRSIKNRESRI